MTHKLVRCPVHTVGCEEWRTFDLQVISSRTCACSALATNPEVKKTNDNNTEPEVWNEARKSRTHDYKYKVCGNNLYVAIMSCRVKLQPFWRLRTSLACFGDSAPCAEKTCRSLCRTRRLTGGRTLSMAANTTTPTLRLQRGRGLGKWLRIMPVTSSPLGLQVCVKKWIVIVILQATPFA